MALTAKAILTLVLPRPSYRIAHLTEHLKVNKKDHTTQRSLKMLVGKRRKLLDYLMRKDINRYRALIAKKELGIRK